MMLFLEEVCSNQNILAVIYFVWTIVSWVLRIVPIILIVMVSLDFAKNVMANGADAMNKNLKMVISRIISCVLCFLVPSFVTTLNTILGDFGVNYSKCFDNIANGVHVDNNSGSLIEDSGNDNKPNVNIGGGSSIKPSSGVSGGGSSSSGGSTGSSTGSNANANSSNFKTYDSYKVIKKLSNKDLKNKIVLPEKVGFGGAQSLAVVNGKILVARASVTNGSSSVLTVMNLSTKKHIVTKKYDLNHAGGMTYNANTKNVYVKLNSGSKIVRSFLAEKAISGENISLSSKDIGKLGSGLAYDSTTNKYYSNDKRSGKIYVFDEFLEYEKSFNLVVGSGKECTSSGANCQDMGAYNGIGMIIFNKFGSGSSRKMAIDFYRLSDGKYLGSYSLPGQTSNGKDFEFESIDYSGSGNNFILLGGVDGTSKDHIYTITINFDDFK